MRWVQQAAIGPHRCAVIPFIGNSNAKGGFLDTGQEMRERDHVYLSREACEMIARSMGWQPQHVAEAYAREVGERDREIADLREQVREADRFAEAAEYTLGRFGQRVQRKPGRKPQHQEAA